MEEYCYLMADLDDSDNEGEAQFKDDEPMDELAQALFGEDVPPAEVEGDTSTVEEVYENQPRLLPLQNREKICPMTCWKWSSRTDSEHYRISLNAKRGRKKRWRLLENCRNRSAAGRRRWTLLR
jgi:hypothetical protein